MRWKPKTKPQTWYAWRPVLTDCGTLVWLEKVKFVDEEYYPDYTVRTYYLMD